MFDLWCLPCFEIDDAMLNAALRDAGLYALQNEDDESRLTLDSAIARSGSNLSVGQRQIVALARAMVRDNKLLILDEGGWLSKDFYVDPG